jgi:hypothetical protein
MNNTTEPAVRRPRVPQATRTYLFSFAAMVFAGASIVGDIVIINLLQAMAR